MVTSVSSKLMFYEASDRGIGIENVVRALRGIDLSSFSPVNWNSIDGIDGIK